MRLAPIRPRAPFPISMPARRGVVLEAVRGTDSQAGTAGHRADPDWFGSSRSAAEQAATAGPDTAAGGQCCPDVVDGVVTSGKIRNSHFRHAPALSH